MAIAPSGKHNRPLAAADWLVRLVTVSVFKTLPIDLSEVVYIAIEPPSYFILSMAFFLGIIAIALGVGMMRDIVSSSPKRDHGSLQKLPKKRSRSPSPTNDHAPSPTNDRASLQKLPKTPRLSIS